MEANKSTVNDLVENNIKLVGHVIKRYYTTYISDDDIFQLGCIGLVKAAKNYNSSKGAFSTYATFYIRGEISDWIRSKNARTRKGDLEISSLDFIASEKGTQVITLHEICGGESFEEQVINNETLRKLINVTELKDEEKQCIELYYFQGFNQVEISKMLNLINISRIINTALKKLRKNALQYVS